MLDPWTLSDASLAAFAYFTLSSSTACLWHSSKEHGAWKHPTM